jgi:hypothetical protein
MNKTSIAQQAKTASFLPPAQGLLQRKCACGNHTVAGGECAECAKNKSGLQRKLTIGASNDPLELEADRVADQVMAAPAHSAVSSAASSRIQRYAGQAIDGSESAPASVDRVLASSGRPLEPALQQDMGQRFGHDFSQVRVHIGATAEQSAQDVNANAYTVGNNIVFGTGQYAPETQQGRRLVAHELTHVIQQSGTNSNFANLQREEAESEDTKPRDESLGIFEEGTIDVLATTATAGAPMLKPVIKGGAIGFYTEVRHQVKEGKGDKFIERFKKLLVSPSDMLAYGKGYLWGILQGLWSPVQGIIDIVKLAWKLQQWQMETLVNVIKNFHEIATMQGTLIDRFSKLGEKAKGFFEGIKHNVTDFIGRLIGAVSGGVFELAKNGGHKAGQAIFKFLEKPWGEIGEGIGTVVGTVLIEVIMAAFSGGIGNAVTKVGQALDKVAPTLMKGVRFIASELGTIIKEIHAVIETVKAGLAKAGRSLLKGMEEFIGEAGGIFDDLIAMLKKLFTGAEEAATKLPVDVPVPVKVTTPHVPAPHSPPAVKSPHLESSPGKKPLAESHVPKESPVEAGVPKKTQPEIIPPKEPAVIKTQAEAVKFAEEHPPKKIVGETGHRRASVGEGHEIIEIPDRNLPSGIGCELHSPSPYPQVPCPSGMGGNKTETLEQFKERGGIVKELEPGKVPEILDSERIKVGRGDSPLRGTNDIRGNRSPSDIDNLPSTSASTAQKITHSADIGVAEGRKYAEKKGLVHVFDNPRGMEHNVPGIDSVFIDKKGNLVVVEFKGGAATLSEQQMTRGWVNRNIEKMEADPILKHHPVVKELRKAFNNKKLYGLTFSTPIDQVTGKVLKTIVQNHGVF